MTVSPRLACLLCVSCAGTMPAIDIAPGAAQVVVLKATDNFPDGCTYVGKVRAEDGLIDGGQGHYRGTRDRALIRIRNEAVRYGANTVYLDEGETVEGVALDDAGGSTILLMGYAYRCPRES